MNITLSPENRISLQWIAAIMAGRPGEWERYRASRGLRSLAACANGLHLPFSPLARRGRPRGTKAVPRGYQICIPQKQRDRFLFLATVLEEPTAQEAIREILKTFAQEAPFIFQPAQFDWLKANTIVRCLLQDLRTLCLQYNELCLANKTPNPQYSSGDMHA